AGMLLTACLDDEKIPDEFAMAAFCADSVLLYCFLVMGILLPPFATTVVAPTSAATSAATKAIFTAPDGSLLSSDFMCPPLDVGETARKSHTVRGEAELGV